MTNAAAANPGLFGVEVPLLDLQAQYRTIQAEIEATVLDVLRSQQFILGPRVEECEQAVAHYCGGGYAVGMSSGTDALLACLMAEGVGAGDEVITSPYSFFATAGAIRRLGATPVFADISFETFNLDPTHVAERITARTKAIIPVHLFGQCADMGPILDIATAAGLIVIEDAAQAIGAQYKGRRAGSMGDYGCFSFFPSKNLGGAGDGGMVVTKNAVKAETLRLLRSHGSKPKYYHSLVGGNFRLDALQAAIITVKLKHLDAWTAGRRQNAERYRTLFQGSGPRTAAEIVLPLAEPDAFHVYNQFVIRATQRDRLRASLKSRHVGTEVYYPVPLHLQACFSDRGYHRGDYPVSEAAANDTLALPVYPELSGAQMAHVVASVAAFYASDELTHPTGASSGTTS